MTPTPLCHGCGHPVHVANDECWWSDLSACPYFRGEGSCTFGCTTEPSCMTDRPREGWPGEALLCKRIVTIGPSPTPYVRCGQPEDSQIHDPLGPPGRHVYDPAPVAVDDGTPTYQATEPGTTNEGESHG